MKGGWIWARLYFDCEQVFSPQHPDVRRLGWKWTHEDRTYVDLDLGSERLEYMFIRQSTSLRREMIRDRYTDFILRYLSHQQRLAGLAT